MTPVSPQSIQPPPPPRELTRAELDAALGLELTDEQWEAVSAPLHPGVIVAGAGSGKTTSMAARVAWLVGSGLVRPDEVLGLTFTTKATAQLLTSMRGSIARLVSAGIIDGEDAEGAPIGDPAVLTYHSFGARIVSEHGIRIGLEPSASVLADGARHELAYRVVCRTSLPLGGAGKSPVAITNALLSLDDELTELAVTPDQLVAFDESLVAMLLAAGKLQRTGEEMLAAARGRILLAGLIREWRAEKASRDVLDFADQIRLAAELVGRFPDVAADLRSRYRVVLLDEYQDTSVAQRGLLQAAFDAGHAVTAVGDPCQAIYGWRGASVDNIDSFHRHFPAADGTPAVRFSLSQNRRSGHSILEIANRESADLRALHPGVEPLRAGSKVGAGAVACALLGTYTEEIDWLVARIEQMHRGGAHWKDIAVLAATGKDLVAVESALRLRGVPTQLAGAAALLAQPAVVDLRSMLELLHDPTANPAFLRVAAGPRWRIGPRDLALLGTRAAELAGGRRRSGQDDLASALEDAVVGADHVETVSLVEALDDLGDVSAFSPEAVERFAGLSAELHALRRRAGDPLADLLITVMRTTGLEVEASLAGEQQRHALHAFVDLAADFTSLDGRATLGAFLARLRDAERFDEDPEFEVGGIADAVQLLTVHKAKGLEFEHVFVPFVSDGAFPGGRARSQWPTSAATVPWHLRSDATDALTSFPIWGESPKAKDFTAYKEILRELVQWEAMRLAYVAFTRAKRSLTVSGHWWGPTQKDPRGPDPFLLGVKRACEDGHGEVVQWAPAPEAGTANPQAEAAAVPLAWPAPLDPVRRAALIGVAAAVDEVASVQQGLVPAASSTGAQSDRVHEWDLRMAQLLEEARAAHAPERVVALPGSVSASLLMRAMQDPDAVALDLVRPMPGQPAPAARRGTQFHAWVESRYGQQSLLDPDDLPGSGDADIVSDADLEQLKEAFENSAYADREPVAVEAPFALVIGGRVVNGRIDAVFQDPDGDYEVVDWKTGSAAHVDPMQLAIYRLAWSQRVGVPLERVRAVFLVVGTGEVLAPDTDAPLAVFDALEREA